MSAIKNNATASMAKQPIDASVPAKIKTATFALGWFWGPDSRFGSIKGVVRTRVGYAGGTRKNPTYHSLGDHTESIQVDYDPDVLSFEKLLDVFWDSHNPFSPSLSRQYMSIIFFHNDEQKRLAMESMNLKATRNKRRIYTKILPFTKFYLAEDYHQKYRLRSDRDLMMEFSAVYPSTQDFVNSTAAARVNGYLNGYGTIEDIMDELPGFGLSQMANKKLIEIVKSRKGK